MGNTGPKTKQEVRSFLKNISWRNGLTFLFFLLLSAVFWIAQVYRERFEVDYVIPIKYTNIPDSIIFEDNLPKDIHAVIKDDGSAFFRYYFSKMNDSVIVDVRDAINSRKSSQRFTVPSENIVQLVRSKLYTGTELVSYSPSIISTQYALVEKKTVPVIYDGYINLAQGYILDGDITFSPEEITVYSSKAILDTTTFVHTVADTVYDLDKSQELVIPLQKMKGMRFSPDSVRIGVTVDKFNTKDVSVPIICPNLPKDLSVKFFPSSIKVSFAVAIKKYKDITEKDFSILVDYNELKDNKEMTIPVRLTKHPDFVRNLVIEPAEVEFILEKE
ncbi:CdaR family protein [Dysgonomonas sp. 25]|uniref:CdaR family protein n=1 Tax=Dysgonomonas sp. 25 TaxID=2302933 RepID=UPI0013D1B171|nr:YbbR-like domain-containing protein [Dysgonomonas sp. 25]NDV69578.1 YbbR-like domain-containing protein [Dysgonomonas sp. 25]